MQVNEKEFYQMIEEIKKESLSKVNKFIEKLINIKEDDECFMRTIYTELDYSFEVIYKIYISINSEILRKNIIDFVSHLYIKIKNE